MTEPTEWIAAPEGCPRFGLRGDDPEAPATVLLWAKLRRNRLLNAIPADGRLTDSIRDGLAQCTTAEEIAWQMQAYQRTIDMSAKDTSYHISRLADAQKSVTEALLYARDKGSSIIPETIQRSINSISRLSNTIKELK